MDILTDEVAPHHYKEAEDLKTFHSEKTGRGPLQEGWQKTSDPVMCSYKSVDVRLDVWGIQGRVESFVHSVRDQRHRCFVCQYDCAKKKIFSNYRYLFKCIPILSLYSTL